MACAASASAKSYSGSLPRALGAEEERAPALDVVGRQQHRHQRLGQARFAHVPDSARHQAVGVIALVGQPGGRGDLLEQRGSKIFGPSVMYSSISSSAL